MASSIAVTIERMIEALPEPEQRQVAEHLREYVADLRDEREWDELVARTRGRLVEAARAARRQAGDGLAVPRTAATYATAKSVCLRCDGERKARTI